MANKITRGRLLRLLEQIQKIRILVTGDVMLDHFVWGRVQRISPEAPVPVVDFERESSMPGGAANVARNITALQGHATLAGVVGSDDSAAALRKLLSTESISSDALLRIPGRLTTTKTRIIAGQQQITRLDRETREPLSTSETRRFLRLITPSLAQSDAVIIGDYGKGVVTQGVVDHLRQECRRTGKWLSLDPKPIHSLDLRRLSLLTPNRKEIFELAGVSDTVRSGNPLHDPPLRQAAENVLRDLEPAILLVTLGELGMLLCQRDRQPVHIPSAAREVFDVSGAGDTVIAVFTLAVTAGASPHEAAVLANEAAGVVVAKRGTATVQPVELINAIRRLGEAP